MVLTATALQAGLSSIMEDKKTHSPTAKAVVLCLRLYREYSAKNMLALSSLPLYYQAVVGMQQAAADLVPLLTEAKSRPYVLASATIDRIVSLHAEQQKDVIPYHRQYQAWVGGDLTDEERQQLNALHGAMLQLTQTHQQVFELVDQIKDYTIDQILKKDTLELMNVMLSEQGKR